MSLRKEIKDILSEYYWSGNWNHDISTDKVVSNIEKRIKELLK